VISEDLADLTMTCVSCDFVKLGLSKTVDAWSTENYSSPIWRLFWNGKMQQIDNRCISSKQPIKIRWEYNSKYWLL